MSSQFHFVKEVFGNLGVFAVVVGWEHIMLFIKYLMHSLISPYPVSVRDAMNKEEYERTLKRHTNLRERNERRSNCYPQKHGSQTSLGKKVNDDEHSKSSHLAPPRMSNHRNENTIQDSRLRTTKRFPPVNDKENSPVPYNNHNEFDPVIPHSAPAGYDNQEQYHLRRRRGNNVQLKKRQANTNPKKKMDQTDINTPKRRLSKTFDSWNSQNSQQFKTIDNSSTSPFGLYFHEYDDDSPLVDRSCDNQSHSRVNDDISLGGLLSVDSNGFCSDGGKGVDNYNRYKPSMSRSRFMRESLEEERAAQERIKKRISSTGERRRRKMV